MTHSHTPGPWVVKEDLDKEGFGAFYICHPGLRSVAVTCGRATHKLVKTSRANARLISAAPEMLQILESILSDRDGLDRLQAFTMNGEFYDPREVISAVVDKAKGEQP